MPDIITEKVDRIKRLMKKLDLVDKGLEAIAVATTGAQKDEEALGLGEQRIEFARQQALLESELEAPDPGAGGIRMPTDSQVKLIETLTAAVERLTAGQTSTSAGITLAGRAFDLLTQIEKGGAVGG